MLTVSEAQLLGWIAAFLLPLFRVLGLMSAAPVLSNRAFPTRARVTFASAIALCAAPSVGLPAGFDIASPNGLLMVGRETLIGFAARLAFTAFEFAGELIGLQMGLSFAGFFDPTAGQTNAIGRMMNSFAMLTYVGLDGPLLMVVAVVRSFATLPIDPTASLPLGRLSPIEAGGELFATGLSIALPFMAMLLFLNVVLGVMSRIAPQLSLFSVGFPLTLGSGLLLFANAFPLIEGPLVQSMERLTALLTR
jgi:flagellar biosynthetic protein FliR